MKRCHPLQDQVLWLFTARTKSFLGQHSKLEIDGEEIRGICDKLSTEKVLSLACPNEFTTSVYLQNIAACSAYEMENIFILRKPEDFYHLRFDTFSLVIIIDAFGKGIFDADHFKQWSFHFDDFEMLGKAGRMNVIMTTSQRVLDDFKARSSDFALLEYKFVLHSVEKSYRSPVEPVQKLALPFKETSYSVFSENRISSNVCANSPVTVHSSDSEASNNHSSISYKSPLISKENSSDSFQDDSTKVQDVISNRFEKKHGKQNYYQRVKDAIDWKDCSNSDCYSDEDSDKTTSNDPPFYLSQANQEGWINETSFEYDGPS